MIRNVLYVIICLGTLEIHAREIEDPDTRTGFAWGGTPVLAFDADLGLRYGAVVNLFDYDDGERYPDYFQYARIRLYHSTKGTSNFSLLYDSEKIFQHSQVTFETSYIEDIALDFYGFNGINSVYSPEFSDPGHPWYINKFYYNHHRRILRTRLDLQTHLSSRKLRLYSGINYSWYRVSDLDYSRFDIPDGRSGNGFTQTTLYRKYLEWDVISPEEKNGGNILSFSAGLIFDTRESKLNCKGGVWFESYFVFSPAGLSSSFYLRQITSLRHYIHWSNIRAVFSYRISSQQKIAGSTPFYALPTFYSSLENHDGLGGAFNLRGIKRNRIVADGYLTGNTEFRKNLLRFRFFRINWETELSVFSDWAYITRQYEASYGGVPDEYRRNILKELPQRLHATFGVGMYLIYNANNVISVNYGISPNPQLGDRRLYIGAGFMF